MSAQEDIRNLANTFGWDTHIERSGDTFLHGQHMVTVDYRHNGSVMDAKRYEFSSITRPEFRESTGSVNKKGDIESWLISLGH